MFRYTRAICREIPKSLVASAIRMDNHGIVDYDLAVLQHEKYVQTLRDLGLQVTVLPSIENLPDCVFVEDPAVVIGKKAVITNLGHPNRKGEAASIQEALQQHGIETFVMEEPSTLDGGDVLFTGHEIFVGLSSRSNKKGVETLGKVFREYPVHGVQIEKALHLKSVVSMCGEDTILFGSSKYAESACNEIMQKASRAYKPVRVPDDSAANCLFINGTIVHRASSEFPDSARILESLDLPAVQLEAGELAKVDGALTCCSLLLQ